MQSIRAFAPGAPQKLKSEPAVLKRCLMLRSFLTNLATALIIIAIEAIYFIVIYTHDSQPKSTHRC